MNIWIPYKKLLVAKSSSSNNIWSLCKDKVEVQAVGSRVRHVCNLLMALIPRMVLYLFFFG